MLANKGYAAYANNKVMTATPAELTLMLYDGAIKFCNIAINNEMLPSGLLRGAPYFKSPLIGHPIFANWHLIW